MTLEDGSFVDIRTVKITQAYSLLSACLLLIYLFIEVTITINISLLIQVHVKKYYEIKET